MKLMKLMKPLAAVLLLGLGLTQAAQAELAADAILQTQSTLSYNEGSDLQALVRVRVNLVEATPTLSAPSDDTISSSQTSTIQYTLTSNANGLDIYNLSFSGFSCETDAGTCAAFSSGVTAGTEANFENFDGTGPAATGTVTLGASSVQEAETLSTTATSVTIDVPSDNSAGDSAINGLAVNDTVVFDTASGDAVCTVTAIDDSNATTATPGSISVNNCDNAYTIAIGDQIGEQATFEVTFEPAAGGAVSIPTPPDEHVDISIEVQDDAAADTAATDTVRVSVTGFTLTITKYVKNTTNPNGTCTESAWNGVVGHTSADTNNFCDDNTVVADPGDAIEYLIVVANGGGSTTTGVVVAEPIANFVTYVANSVDQLDDSGTWDTDDLDTDNDGDRVETDAPAPNTSQLLIYVNGGTDTSNAGGSMDGSDTVYIIYKATVQN